MFKTGSSKDPLRKRMIFQRPVFVNPKTRQTKHPMVWDKTFVTLMRSIVQKTGRAPRYLNKQHANPNQGKGGGGGKWEGDRARDLSGGPERTRGKDG